MKEIDCVMLAAGESTRMGQWKMTLPFSGSTITETSVRNALEVCGRVLLVTGYRADDLEALFEGNPRVLTLRNKNYARGMFSSIQTGVRAVASDGFFLALGDMPLVPPPIYRYLLTFTGQDAVIPKYHGKKGHPVLFSGRAKNFLLSLPPEDTLRTVIAAYPSLAVPVDDRGVLADIDTPEDYSSLTS